MAGEKEDSVQSVGPENHEDFGMIIFLFLLLLIALLLYDYIQSSDSREVDHAEMHRNEAG